MQKFFKTIGAYTESTGLIFKTFKKNYSARDTVQISNETDEVKACRISKGSDP
jgi:hypothetical protein